MESNTKQNNKIETFDVDGNTYKYINGKYYDEHYCVLPKSEMLKVIRARIEHVDYKSLSADDIIILIKECKDNEVYTIAKTISEYALKSDILNIRQVRTLLPIFSSCCRSTNMPQEAIEKCKIYLTQYPGAFSPMLDTSLAAAYCDIMDYDNARKYINRAYAQSAHLSIEDRRQISLVYKRIQSETGTITSKF